MAAVHIRNGCGVLVFFSYVIWLENRVKLIGSESERLVNHWTVGYDLTSLPCHLNCDPFHPRYLGYHIKESSCPFAVSSYAIVKAYKHKWLPLLIIVAGPF
eukprot:TRINITY_DN32962_c2_g1_i1.p1 TRINITY_DN32962_c2_g1~~TRINITY_DN32962_c2_g1_i1.p1  ORF type:complete len:101 (+),score=5.30 TRINITY_DN32962_c2_g1_i1:1414-1716(+)